MPFGVFEGVQRPEDRDAKGIDRVLLIVRRRGRAGQIAENVARDVVGLDHVMLDESETGAPEKHGRVGPQPGMVVIEADDLMPVGQQAHDQVGAQESSRACDEVAHAEEPRYAVDNPKQTDFRSASGLGILGPRTGDALLRDEAN